MKIQILRGGLDSKNPKQKFSIFQNYQKIEYLEISPTELGEYCLKKLDRLLNTFITIVDEGEIYDEARNTERKIKHGHYKGPLHGIPFFCQR